MYTQQQRQRYVPVIRENSAAAIACDAMRETMSPDRAPWLLGAPELQWPNGDGMHLL